MLKLAYKNFTESKLRSLAIIFTITAAVFILFMALSYKDITYTQFSTATKVEAENADIRIDYLAGADSRVISTTPLEPILDDTDMTVGVLDLYGKSQLNGTTQYINLRGVQEENFYKLNNITIKKGLDRPLRSDEIIIDRYTSAILNLDIDSMVEVTVGALTQRFFVATIVENHPCFDTDAAFVIYCMENTASKFVGGHFGNLYNKIFIKTADNVDTNQLISAIKDIPEYANYNVAKENDTSLAHDKAFNASLPMIIALWSCAVFALYLVYLIINNALKRRTLFISRLQSIGATHGYITGVFLLESVMYTVMGVTVGVIISLLLISGGFFNLANVSLQNTFYVKMLVLSAVFTVMLFLLCMLSAILKNSKTPVIAQYKASKNTLRTESKPFAMLAIVAFLVSIALILPKYLDKTRGILAFAMCIVSVSVLLPYLARLLVGRVKNLSYSSSFVVVANNISREKTSANNLRIIFLGIVICSVLASSAFRIQHIKDSLVGDIECDIVIANVQSGMDKQLNDIASHTELYNIHAISIKDTQIKINGADSDLTLLAVPPDQLEHIGKVTYITPKEILSASLDKGIALNYSYHKVYKLEIGDSIPFTLNGQTHLIKITAFFNTYQYGGKLGIVSNAFLSRTFDLPLYDTVIAKTTADIDATIAKLRSAYGDTNIVVLDFESLYSSYDAILTNTVMLTKLFTLVIIAVCLASVIFNIINAREEKKIEIYKMYSLGFSKKQIMCMELGQNLCTAALAFVASLAVQPILNSGLTNAFSMGHLYITRPLSYLITTIISAGFMLALTLCSLTAYFVIDNKHITTLLKQD